MEDLAFDAQIADQFGEMTSTATFLGAPLFDATSLLQLAVHFAFNLIVSWIIVAGFYYRKSRRKDYSTTFMLFSTSIFLLLFLMPSVNLDTSFALGLFVIFGIIRYRTEMIPIREMTYLFLIIVVAVLNGINLSISYAELITANALIILLLWLLEEKLLKRRKGIKLVTYERIELIVPHRRAELLADLEARLGIAVERVEVGNVDFLRDVAFLKVYYTPSDDDTCSMESITKLNERTRM